MKELDVVFERYFRQRYPEAANAERRAFERLLEREDPEIWSWLMGQAQEPAEFTDVIDSLRRKH